MSLATKFKKSTGNISEILKKKSEDKSGDGSASGFADKHKKSGNQMTAKSLPAESDGTDLKKSNKSDLIYLVKGVDEGRNAWYYVLVERLKLSMFLKALNDDIIHLENYGIILYSAYGDEPPQHITDKVKEEYGIK